DALQRLLSPLGGMTPFVQPGERVLIKPNLLAAKPPEAAVTTHPALVRAVINLVREAGATPIVGDSPGLGGVRRVAEKSGILAVLEETNTELVEFNEPAEVETKGLFRRLELARPYLEADRIINLPKLKTHEMMTLTCGVKNLFGAVVGTAKAGWHLKAGADRELFAQVLMDIWQARPPELTIVDAVLAMEGNGPGSGDPRHMGLLLAGSNTLAVDLMAAELAGIPRKLLPVERLARKLGLTGADRRDIELAGVPLEELAIPPFRLPPLADVQFGLPAFLARRLRHQLTSRPVAIEGKCRLCGVCVNACPPKAMTITNGTLRIDYDACIRCFCCRELCPDAALDVRQGMLLRILKRHH
ncbi:MAG TPA: DUF362 domain-containing protein, partial [Geobacterales bacterium]|nr:DUF362 domain-containing protein [Geobacterales bacterium]